MKKSLKKRLCIIGVSLIGVFVLLNIIFTFLGLSRFASYITARQMEKLAVLMETEYDESNSARQDYIEQLDESYNTKITIIDEKKDIILTTKNYADKKKKIGPITEKLFDENIDKLNSGKTASVYSKYENKVESIYIIVIRKIDQNRYVVLTRTFKSLQNTTYAAIWFDMIVGCVIIILGFFVVLKLSKYLVKPINEMKQIAEHISNLEFDAKVTLEAEDELGQLGYSINRMSEYLENNVEQLQNDIENRKRLLRNLSHEIKSPVAVIMGYADRMKVILEKNPEKASQYCEIISNESNRIDILVKEMLEFSRLEQRMEMIQPERFDVKRLFENIRIRIAEEYLEKKVSLQFEYDDTDVLVADYGLLERAVYNLINNGISHSADEHVVITVSGTRNGKWYRIKVHNTGSHIPEEELPAIWDAFYKVDKARVRNKNGCGIGLSIVREIMESHQGTYAAGNDQEGVFFIISLPDPEIFYSCRQ